jgi:hypothetical protein
MDSKRWSEIIATAAAQAIDECGNAPTIQAVALKAATLAAEWVAEELAEEQRLASDG